MKVRNTKAGALTAFTSMFLALLALFSFMDAQTFDEQLGYAAIGAVFLFWRFRVGQTGVFDTPDGLVVRRLRRKTVEIPTASMPTVEFDKWFVVHRMFIRTNDGARVSTDFLFTKPVLESRLELPDNLREPTALPN
jgi:hypothetical protein